jgi:hypothetical protein
MCLAATCLALIALGVLASVSRADLVTDDYLTVGPAEPAQGLVYVQAYIIYTNQIVAVSPSGRVVPADGRVVRWSCDMEPGPYAVTVTWQTYSGENNSHTLPAAFTVPPDLCKDRWSLGNVHVDAGNLSFTWSDEWQALPPKALCIRPARGGSCNDDTASEVGQSDNWWVSLGTYPPGDYDVVITPPASAPMVERFTIPVPRKPKQAPTLRPGVAFRKAQAVSVVRKFARKLAASNRYATRYGARCDGRRTVSRTFRCDALVDGRGPEGATTRTFNCQYRMVVVARRFRVIARATSTVTGDGGPRFCPAP